MYPWLWLWSPQIHFPWSGSVAQDIHPDTNWFTAHIQGGAGDADVERGAFAVASYGKQLGLITEVLLAVAEQQAALAPEADAALDRLRKIKTAIDAIKPAARA